MHKKRQRKDAHLRLDTLQCLPAKSLRDLIHPPGRSVRAPCSLREPNEKKTMVGPTAVVSYPREDADIRRQVVGAKSAQIVW